MQSISNLVAMELANGTVTPQSLRERISSGAPLEEVVLSEGDPVWRLCRQL